MSCHYHVVAYVLIFFLFWFRVLVGVCVFVVDS